MKKRSRQQGLREEVLREWRGYAEAGDPEAGIRPASALVAAVLRALRSAGLADGFDEEELRRAWQELAGDFIARHSQPESVRGGVLVLRVAQPSMRFHLEQSKGLLLERLRERFGRDRIKEIKFRHG
jgi:predicted nucleic acid-binding Zn ribbon protein